jgi:hypothetical protein
MFDQGLGERGDLGATGARSLFKAATFAAGLGGLAQPLVQDLVFVLQRLGNLELHDGLLGHQ